MPQIEPAKHFSAWDLLELLDRNNNALEGDQLSVLQIYEMPPWDQVCRA
jgi:hypothetical protein